MSAKSSGRALLDFRDVRRSGPMSILLALSPGTLRLEPSGEPGANRDRGEKPLGSNQNSAASRQT